MCVSFKRTAKKKELSDIIFFKVPQISIEIPYNKFCNYGLKVLKRGYIRKVEDENCDK